MYSKAAKKANPKRSKAFDNDNRERAERRRVEAERERREITIIKKKLGQNSLTSHRPSVHE